MPHHTKKTTKGHIGLNISDDMTTNFTMIHMYVHHLTFYNYLAPGGGCEVLFLSGLFVCVCVSVGVSVSGQYFGILFIGY